MSSSTAVSSSGGSYARAEDGDGEVFVTVNANVRVVEESSEATSATAEEEGYDVNPSGEMYP